MQILIKINKAVGLVDGWTDYMVECSNTSYDDKDTLKSLGMLWSPEAKKWYKSGSINADIAYTRSHIIKKMAKIDTNPIIITK